MTISYTHQREWTIIFAMISSTKNLLIKRIRRLQQKKHRLSEEVFFIEGLRVVATAVEMGAEIEQIVWCDSLLVSDFGRSLLSKAPATEVSEPVFRSISDREQPVGIGAVVRLAIYDLPFTTVAADSVFVALYEISDPGNLGTIIRTVDAAGGAGVILVGNTVDPFHPTAVKASMGTVFNVVIRESSAENLIQWANAHQMTIVATSAKGSVDYRAISYPKPALLLMGSEREGLPTHILQQADQSVAIPMRGTASSLNLAVATGILLYEMTPPD
jgi:TrmH family RNA methyltransferase